MKNRYAALLLTLFAVVGGISTARAGEATQRFDPSKYSQVPTACDVLAMPHRAKAVEGRHPQALFVVGYLYLTGQNENPKDPCRAGELIRESAIEGRIAGQIGFPRYAMHGLFDGCDVTIDRTEMLGFLDAAAEQVGGDYYRTMLLELVRQSVNA
jgi:TPR repeat protein